MSSGVTVFYWDRVFVFSLGGLNRGPHGWKASDFAEGRDHIWAGTLRINNTSAGSGEKDQVSIVLEHDPKDGKSGVFAVCEVSKENVEPVIDSSRFFVLKISNGSGKFALIGLGFNEKNAAFDFKHELSSQNQKQLGVETMIEVEKQDYSLKAPITVAIVNKPMAPEKISSSSVLANTSLVSLDKSAASTSTGGRRRGGGARAPAPAASTLSSPASSTLGGMDLDFSSSMSPASSGASTPAPKPAAAAPKEDLFASLGGSVVSPKDTPVDLLDSFFSSPVASPVDTTPAPTQSQTKPLPKTKPANAKKSNDPFDFDGTDWTF